MWLSRSKHTGSRKHLGLAGGYGLLLSVALSAGATSFADILDVQRQTVQDGAATQREVEALDDQHGDRVAEYRQVLKQTEDLRKYNEQLRLVQQAQTEEAALLREQLSKVGSLEQDILPLMGDMLDALEEFVALDAPFLERERRQRVANLRKLLSSSQPHSEKYRRILEAYQIENDYGRTVEAYDAPIEGDRGEEVVTFLKIGRVVFVYQRLDGSRSYLWDRHSRNWAPLPREFDASITRGIRMAREQIPSDLLILPVSTTQF